MNGVGCRKRILFIYFSNYSYLMNISVQFQTLLSFVLKNVGKRVTTAAKSSKKIFLCSIENKYEVQYKKNQYIQCFPMWFSLFLLLRCYYDIWFTIVTWKEIVWIHESFLQNFQNMATIAGGSFTEVTDLFRGALGCQWNLINFGILT